jgi:phosphinothricin acetyltransferase
MRPDLSTPSAATSHDTPTWVNRDPDPAATETRIRPAREEDLASITQIYNHYVIGSPCTFDTRPFEVEERRTWWNQFRDSGRHRLLVAESGGAVIGFTGTTRFRPRPAYDTTVETTVYCAPGWTGGGLGSRLYSALFEALRGEDVALLVAGFTVPNPSSEALHRRFGFRPVGVFHGCGRKFDRYWDVQWNERPWPEPRLGSHRSSSMKT